MRRTAFAARFAVALVAALVLAGAAAAGQVPAPINAPATIGSGNILAASGTNPQQAADSGITTTAAGQNKVVAGPASGGAGALSLRALATADLPNGTGTVTSVALSLPAMFSISGSPITASGTLAATLATQSANLVFAGPASGVAAAPTFRALAGADLPSPSASSLGGVQSAAAVAHQWVNSISTAGVPALSQPAATDLAAQAANTVVGNATGSSAAPTALALPSCSNTTSALNWTSGTGFGCNALGTMATQAASAVAITGGTISGVTINAVSQFTVLSGSTSTHSQVRVGLTSSTAQFSVAASANDIINGSVSGDAIIGSYAAGQHTWIMAAGNPSMEYDPYGHQISQGYPAPTAGTGTASIGGTAGGNDNDFTATAGTGVTSSTVTFYAGTYHWPSTPLCVVTGNSAAAYPYISSVSTSSLVIGWSASVSGAVATVHCSD